MNVILTKTIIVITNLYNLNIIQICHDAKLFDRVKWAYKLYYNAFDKYLGILNDYYNR